MATKFLTNTSKDTMLSERVESLTKKNKKLYFLVGYFYFSGFCEIANDFTR